MYHIEWYTTHETNNSGSFEIFAIKTNDEMVDEDGEASQSPCVLLLWPCLSQAACPK